jgi:hypothetical protein
MDEPHETPQDEPHETPHADAIYGPHGSPSVPDPVTAIPVTFVTLESTLFATVKVN